MKILFYVIGNGYLSNVSNGLSMLIKRNNFDIITSPTLLKKEELLKLGIKYNRIVVLFYSDLNLKVNNNMNKKTRFRKQEKLNRKVDKLLNYFKSLKHYKIKVIFNNTYETATKKIYNESLNDYYKLKNFEKYIYLKSLNKFKIFENKYKSFFLNIHTPNVYSKDIYLWIGLENKLNIFNKIIFDESIINLYPKKIPIMSKENYLANSFHQILNFAKCNRKVFVNYFDIYTTDTIKIFNQIKGTFDISQENIINNEVKERI